MIGATVVSAALCFLAPECGFPAGDLQCQVCIAPFLLSCLPLAVAAVATALVVAVNSIIQVMCREDCPFPSDRSQIRSDK